MGQPGRQMSVARAQVLFDVGRMEVALAAVAGDAAVWRDCTAESSGAASKAEGLWEARVSSRTS